MKQQILKAIDDMVNDLLIENATLMDHEIEATQITVEEMADHFELKLREGLK